MPYVGVKATSAFGGYGIVEFLDGVVTKAVIDYVNGETKKRMVRTVHYTTKGSAYLQLGGKRVNLCEFIRV